MLIFLIILAVAVFIGLLALKLYLSSPKTKGRIGENQVADILGDCKDGSQYVINDLLFIDNKGSSRQIDHIVINEYGIWVIETKNYKGNIYGNESQRQWTQVLAYGNVRNQFYNPIKQNTTHIYSLAEKLNVKRYLFHNVIVFPDNTDITGISSSRVYHMSELRHLINNGNICIPTDALKGLYNKILSLRSNEKIDLDEHIENIHEMQRRVKRGICPRCGGKLVLRNGKNGQFYGCSNFPKCKFTINSDL